MMYGLYIACIMVRMTFEHDESDVADGQREPLLNEIEQAEAEYAAGETREFADVEALLDELSSG